MRNELLPLSIPGWVPAELGLKRATNEVFEMLGFSQGILRNALDADGLRFTAGLAPWGWCLSREGRLLAREAIPPNETVLAPSCSPIEVMAAMYTLWAEVYGKGEPHDEALRLGKQWLAFKKEARALIPQMPSLRVDRVFFRQCLKYVERRQDWMIADYGIHFSYVTGQLRLKAGETEVYCPAIGQWLGSMLVSAQALYTRLPLRFRNDTIVLTACGDSLTVDSRVIPAVWSE